MWTRNKKARDLEASKSNNDSPYEELNQDHQLQLKIDHELFLEAFEKPTQIYRYLRQRSLKCPMFLQRNLSFMRMRRSGSRSKKFRSNFKLESLLEEKESEICQADNQKMNRYMKY